jgi:hypothetical protein
VVLSLESDLLDSFSDEERKELCRLLKKLFKQLAAVSSSGGKHG